MTNPSLAAHTAVDGAVDTLRGPLTTFLQSLVATPSVTGHERDAQRLIEAKYRALGLDVTLLESTHSLVASHPAFSDDGLPLVDRVNVIGAWRGTGAPEARSLILNGHVDVVPEGDRARWTVEPFGGIEREGFIYGRGACDMKGGLVASAFAIEALKAIGFQPGADVTLESVVGEETGGVGTLTTIIHGIRADGCIITEPTHLGIWTAQSGALTFRITVRGLLAHAAFKSHGVSAIELFAPILAMLQRLDVERHQRHSHPLFQDPTNIAPISVGVVRAGDWPSTVPALLVAEGRFGVFPGETIAEARATLEQALHREAERHPWLRDHPPTLEWFEGQFESGEIAPDAPIVRTVAAEHARVHGAEARLGGVPAGTDARLFLRHADIPTVLYGAGELTAAHTFDERVGIEEVIQCTKVLAHTIIAWCGAGASGGVSAGEATLGDTIRAVRDSGVTR